MPRIFISYRRKDSEAITGRIYDRLVGAFGEDNIFQDVESIPPGVDFRVFLRDQVAQCDVVLVIIGQSWHSILDEQGRKRLTNPADFVRIEVENALNQGKHVVPVLVDGAGMPYSSDLPSSIQELCFRNAAAIRHNPDFHRDANRLIDGINWWSNSIELNTDLIANSTSKALTSTSQATIVPSNKKNPRLIDKISNDEDEMYEEAVAMVRSLGKASISLIQRRLRIGYTRASRIIDSMELHGIIGPAQEGSKPREVLK